LVTFTASGFERVKALTVLVLPCAFYLVVMGHAPISWPYFPPHRKGPDDSSKV
jgi:hypothetical protein